MSRKSRKGFQKLENHELAEFTTLQGEESGSDSEMVELSREDSSGRGSACCWCVALYLVLLTCFLVLMAMIAIYFGYNMMRISSDYSHRLDSLEDRVSQLDSMLDSTRQDYSSKMEQLQELVVQVNTSLFSMRDSMEGQQLLPIQGKLDAVELSVSTLQSRVSDFESHPPTIGEDEVQKMRSHMAEFKSHLESYDSQLSDVMRTVGDARHDLTQTDERVELLKRNVTSLKGRLSGLQLQDQDTSNSLELLSAQFSALQMVVREINETVNQEVALTNEELNETRSGLENVQQQLSAVRAELLGLSSDIVELNETLHQRAGEPVVVTEPTDTATQSTTLSPEPATEPTSPTTEPTKPATEHTKPATEPTEPVSETTEPTTEPPETTEPTTEHTEPSSETTEPSSKTTEPETSEPATEPTNPATATVSTILPNVSNSTDAVGELSSDTAPQSTDATPQLTGEVASSSGDSEIATTGTNEANEPTNEGEQPVTTPPSGQPMTVGTHTVDSTGATEDIPDSAGDRNATSENVTGNIEPPTPPSVVPAVPTQNETGTPSPYPAVDAETPSAHSDPIVALRALLDSWDYLDLDMDGRLDMSEFSEYFQQSSVSQSVFERLDANRDNFITKEEINMAMYLLKGETAKGTDGSDNTAGGNAAETQSSSAPVSVSPPTGTEASAPLPDTTGSPSATDLLIDILNNFQRLDTNADGSLNQNEFSVYFGGFADYVFTIFSRLDADGDQLVTRPEIQNAIRMLAEPTTGESVHAQPGYPTAPTSEEAKTPEDLLAEYINSGTN